MNMHVKHHRMDFGQLQTSAFWTPADSHGWWRCGEKNSESSCGTCGIWTQISIFLLVLIFNFVSHPKMTTFGGVPPKWCFFVGFNTSVMFYFQLWAPPKNIFFVVLKLQYFCHFFLQFWAPPKTRIFGAALISITFVVLIFKSFVMKEERGLKVTTKIRKPHLIQNPICMIFP